MAKEYQTRPSQILAIDEEYTAYCFDEVCLFIEAEATDKKGKVNWNKFKWQDTEKKGNQEFIDFVSRMK